MPTNLLPRVCVYATRCTHTSGHRINRTLFNVISPKTREFINRFFPDVKDEQWNDWRWQIRNRIQSLKQFTQYVQLSDKEEQALSRGRKSFPFAITPYYLSLISPTDPSDPIRLSVVPNIREYDIADDEKDDPLNEDGCSPVRDWFTVIPTGFCFWRRTSARFAAATARVPG